VRESQQAVFFYNGRAQDTFGTGRHTLETANLPILNKIMGIPWGMTSPLRAEVYICNMKVFPNLTWGTRDPVAFRDSELGLIRLRAFGMFNMQISDPRLFINSLVGTQGIFTEEEIGDYLSRVIVSRFNDFMGQKLDSIFNLPARYHELSEELKGLIADEFFQYGLKLLELFISSITPPPEVQKAIDDKSKLGIFDDLNKLLQMKAAMALESAAQNPGQAGAGLGMGVGVMMPGMIADALKTQTPQTAPVAAVSGAPCASCRQITPPGAKFCPYCGQPISAQPKCSKCGADLTVGAKFCTQCGQPAI
jgi:membrane protease subunit (stomatin/prohibitin family)